MAEPLPALCLRIASVQVGMPRQFPADDSRRPWVSGIIKEPVQGKVDVGPTNLGGDGQADLVHHGGADKAVLLYPGEHFRHWQTEFPDVRWGSGTFGENFTTSGGLETDVCIGDVFAVNNCRLQVSQPRQPCWKLSRRWELPSLAVRVQQTRRTGWYFRVLQCGSVGPGDSMVLCDRPHRDWTVAAANDVMYGKPRNLERRAELAACEALSHAWRSVLVQRDEPRPERGEDHK